MKEHENTRTGLQRAVIFKKYSPMGEVNTLAAQLAEVLSRQFALTAFVCDRDRILAGSGSGRPARRRCRRGQRDGSVSCEAPACRFRCAYRAPYGDFYGASQHLLWV